MVACPKIIVLCMFVSLMLRYDLHRAVSSLKRKDSASVAPSALRGFSRPYFTAGMTAYVLGLVTTCNAVSREATVGSGAVRLGRLLDIVPKSPLCVRYELSATKTAESVNLKLLLLRGWSDQR